MWGFTFNAPELDSWVTVRHTIVRKRYADFGPTLAAEKLSELHGLDLGVETLRQWMIGPVFGFGGRTG